MYHLVEVTASQNVMGEMEQWESLLMRICSVGSNKRWPCCDSLETLLVFILCFSNSDFSQNLSLGILSPDIPKSSSHMWKTKLKWLNLQMFNKKNPIKLIIKQQKNTHPPHICPKKKKTTCKPPCFILETFPYIPKLHLSVWKSVLPKSW